MTTSGARAPNSVPPERGSFPLDHFGECATQVKAYLTCLKQSAFDAKRCTQVTRDYFECRMAHGLMAKEDLDDLVEMEQEQKLADETQSVPALPKAVKHEAKEGEEVIAGLYTMRNRAERKKQLAEYERKMKEVTERRRQREAQQ